MEKTKLEPTRENWKYSRHRLEACLMAIRKHGELTYQELIEITGIGYNQVRTYAVLLEAEGKIESKLQDPNRPRSKTNKKIWRVKQ